MVSKVLEDIVGRRFAGERPGIVLVTVGLVGVILVLCRKGAGIVPVMMPLEEEVREGALDVETLGRLDVGLEGMVGGVILPQVGDKVDGRTRSIDSAVVVITVNE